MTPSRLEVPADFESIRAIGEWLRCSMDQLGIDSSDNVVVGPIELAVHELATNSVDHAKAEKIFVDATRTDTALIIKVADDGPAQFDGPASRPEPIEPQVRGYGLMIVERVAQSVRYQRSGTTNEWELTFSLDF